MQASSTITLFITTVRCCDTTSYQNSVKTSWHIFSSCDRFTEIGLSCWGDRKMEMDASAGGGGFNKYSGKQSKYSGRTSTSKQIIIG